ncbi:SpoIIE family protein phosphatase [Actinoplanes regularis]|uniref:histidine kinase n=1 Tax=Actinoplanes regularis TaxID=52697 RepID=A0A238YBW8_9ACTN|nr:SpoIIE family protein phosphatase [Actinoplanes regularis]GIE86012.1 histidine kinase [Actinoplanes regularis]SNR68627.1 PAS domain S-box-containing protein [Actinoplanes regularis]
MSDVFAADAEVGRDLAAVDWKRTPVGPPEGWPQSLRTAVSILLSSRFPMWMAWGPGLTFFCNAAYRRDTLGRKYPWALGRSASEVWAEIWADIGPRVQNVLDTGHATWDEDLLLFLERSGYPEESYHTFSYSPLRDDDGALVGMLCVVSEETDRVIAERRMATLRDLGSDPSVVRTEDEALAFAALQLEGNRRDLPFTVTYIFDENGRARRRSSTGLPPGHPVAPAILGDDHPWLTVAESRLVPLEGPGLPTGDWPKPPREALVVPLLRQGDAPYGFLVAALNRYRPADETYRGFIELIAGHLAAGIAGVRSYRAQQRRAEELAELDRAKTTFFSNISHEFRTPLTLIMGPLDELRTRLDSADPAILDELEVIHRNGLRLGKLVNALLDFARLEAGRMQARYEQVDLAATTAELAGVFRSAVERAGLAFEVDCPPLPEPVLVDRGMWEKVVLNLLSNALKFTFDGSIRVTVRAGRGEAVITVADSGIGIAPEAMPRLFERFHRIENVRARSNEGSGIGLAMVKELVGLHHGTVSAESTPGEGTTFTVRLPFGTAHLPPDAIVTPGEVAPVLAAARPFLQEADRWSPGSPPPGPRPAGRPGGDVADIVVADDNADMREYLTRLLCSAGHRVVAVGDGRQALDAVRTEAPDLVVSDVMMPRMTGLELVAALRGDSRTAGVPVLLLSARAGAEASIEGLDAGADDYLFKPFSAAELLARVRANVELARLRNHHARWRTALVDSLQEAFFICADDGAVIEINAAFTEITGYGPEGLPYAADHPWWPDPEIDPEAYAEVIVAFDVLMQHRQGRYTVPLVHRDGHRLWVAAAFNQVRDPESGRLVIVGTFRDVTDEHYAIQRETALASLSMRLSEADDLADALAGACDELRGLWQASYVLAAVFDGADPPALTVTDPEMTWENAPRQQLLSIRDRPMLTPVTEHTTGAGIALEHPRGTMVLWVGFGNQRPFTEQDQTLLALLAGHLGQSLRRVHQIDQQRETALALQRAILGPDQLPAGFAVRYEPATRPLKVGGDWFDTVPLPDGQIGLVVGDCVGHGLPAATVMGQLRSAFRALLLQDPSPARALSALDRFAALLPGASCATVFCGVLDPASGHLRYSAAGHPPPIIAHADGSTELLDQGRSRPIAIRPHEARPEATFDMPPRTTLLLYTDGLVERRRRPLTDGIDEATTAVRLGRRTPVEDLATEVMTRLAPEDGFDDDVALLLYRQPGPLELEFPAESSRLSAIRAALRGWLERCGVDPAISQNVLIAAGEACANAIEHGNRDHVGGLIRLRAAATADALRLIVTDSGRWRIPSPGDSPHRGRGIMLMRAFMSEVRITTGAAGTTIDMQTRIAT